MNVIVSKFGGSSLADADCFRRVREIVRSRNTRRYIILSAPGKRNADDEKITDLLMRANVLYASGGDGSHPVNIVRERFTQIIRELRLSISQELLVSLESDVQKSADEAASRGEYLCARLFSAYTGIPFVDASELIHFDKNGRIQRDETVRAICAMSARFPYAVIPGFYGALPDGTIRTFPRGGSDITGAIVAAALNADIYENWTDVDGLMSADPSVCSDAVCHPAVSYRQMRMLANAGAQVLHPYCVEPVCEAQIPTVLKNTFSPELPGTYISDSVRKCISCICARKDCAAVQIDALGKEAQAAVRGLSVEEYSNGIILLKEPCNIPACIPAAVISAFSLPKKMRSKATSSILPLGELHSEECSKYIVHRKEANAAQQKLHALMHD